MAYKVSNDIDIDRQEYRIQVSLYHCYSMEYKYRKIIRHPRKYVFCKSGANCNLHRLDRPGGLPSPFWKQFQARIQPCIKPRIFFFMGPFWVPLPGLGIPRASGEPGWQGKSSKQLPMCVFLNVRWHGRFVNKPQKQKCRLILFCDRYSET